MSNFLSNLAARSLNKAKVVRPRLPSLFEPQNSLFIGTETEYLRSEYPIEDVHEEAAIENRSNDSPKMRNIEMKHSDASLGNKSRHEIETRPEDFEQHVLRPKRMENKPQAASEGPSLAQENRSNHSQASTAWETMNDIDIANHRLKPEPAFEDNIPEGSMSYDEVRHHLRAVGSLPEIGRQKATEFAAFRRGSEPISARVFRGQQQPVQSVVRADRSEMVNTNAHPMYPHGTHYSEPAALRQIKPMNAPEPAIEVTIGRIEVRATPSTSQPRVQSQKSSKMSLDEYLHQRSEGGIK
jgi:hypothetical protein